MFNSQLVIVLVLAPFALGDEGYTCDTFANIYENGELAVLL